MTVSRRNILRLCASLPLLGAARADARPVPGPDPLSNWSHFRSLFNLEPGIVHMSAMLLASHPASVRAAIARHQRALDADPVAYLEDHGPGLTEASREAAADYLGIHPSRVALTESTTMGVGLVYTSLQLTPDQEVLTTDEDYYVTHASLEQAARRTGAKMRRLSLFDDVGAVNAEQIVERITSGIRPETRLLALTWVHSSTGLKLPVRDIASALREINSSRDEADQVLFGLDAVHGFGVETDSFSDTGADFLMAGCHKWLFGPRGTGIAAISSRGLAATRPTIPSFDESEVFSAWFMQREPRGSNNGRRMTPGGFKAFEHRWALREAFQLHGMLGRTRVASRTHELAGALKDALAGVDRITVRTPRDSALSSGIVAFNVEGMSSAEMVSRLRDRNIVASVAPYPSALVRLTPSIINTAAEIDQAVRAVRDSL